MRSILLGFAAYALIATSCSKSEVFEDVNQDNSSKQLRFGMVTGTQTRAFETIQGNIEGDADVTNAIKLHAYELTTTPDVYAAWFDDDLYSDGDVGNATWKINSIRFTNAKATKYVTYWPANNVTSPSFDTANFTPTAGTFPSFNYAIVGTTTTDKAVNQIDLMGSSDNIAAGTGAVTVKMRHLLSQVNFGVYGINAATITISAITVNNVKSTGTYTYNAGTTYPIGAWSAQGTTANYPYTVLGGATNDAATALAPPSAIELTGNKFIYGDGGNFAAGNATDVFYNDSGWKNVIDIDDANGNSLMLMPQTFTALGSKVSFTFSITSWDSKAIATNATAEFDLFGTTPGDEWKQNYRYIYMIDFSAFLASNQLTFSVDANSTPWQNYDGNVGDEDPGRGTGIITSPGTFTGIDGFKTAAEAATATTTLTFIGDASTIALDSYTMTAVHPAVITIVFNGTVPTTPPTGTGWAWIAVTKTAVYAPEATP